MSEFPAMYDAVTFPQVTPIVDGQIGIGVDYNGSPRLMRLSVDEARTMAQDILFKTGTPVEELQLSSDQIGDFDIPFEATHIMCEWPEEFYMTEARCDAVQKEFNRRREAGFENAYINVDDVREIIRLVSVSQS
jgi:predicted Rdx family selenoprotein